MRWKSIGAVVAGILFVVLVTTAVDVLLHLARVYPSWTQPLTNALALLATAYRIVIGIGGAWLTARLAPFKPLKHAMILGIVGTVLGIVGLVATWNLGLGPRWYPIAVAVLALPQSWIGGRVYERRSNHGVPQKR